MKLKIGDIILGISVLVIVLIIIVPLSPAALDFLFIVNIILSFIILLTSLYITEPLQFSVFPTLLLLITLFRLGLNVAATRLILSNGGQAGAVINTFGSFVIGDNLVVGIIIFLIILIMQFVVITKGSERVAEVSARFTLDAMPGKQMAIDADLNSGIIDEKRAQQRRKDVQREADFYGSMDGASKFIKGDSVVGIIVTLIIFVGGIIIGMVVDGRTFDEVINIFSLATIGEGLVMQIPSLLVSTATGITVTRAASDNNIGIDIKEQLFGRANIMTIAALIILVLGLMPGLPKLPIMALAGLLFLLSYLIKKSEKKEINKAEIENEEILAKEKKKPEDINSLLQVDPIELEFGYNIIPLVDVNQGGDILDRIVAIRKQCAIEMGVVVPVIRLRDNMQLDTNKYVIKVRGSEVSSGSIMPDYYLGMKSSDEEDDVEGIDTYEPAFGLPAKWINENNKDDAEMAGYTLIDPSSVIATHLTEVIKRYGHELLGRQQVQNLIDNIKKEQPVLVEEVVPKVVSLGEVQKVLSNLLREGVPIKDLASILETLGDYGQVSKDTDVLTEYVRQNMKRTITNRFIPGNNLIAITLDPDLEQLILNNIHQTKQGSYVTIEPEKLQAMLVSLKNAINKVNELGTQPTVVTSPIVRFHFKKMTDQLFPELVVLSYNEIEQHVQIHAKEVVSIQ